MRRKLRTLHAQHHGVYGVNRLTVRMKSRYPTLGRCRICRFMKELEIQGKTRRNSRRTTVLHHCPHGIQYYLQRDFRASHPR